MSRIEKEKDIVSLMIRLYCSKNHDDLSKPCSQCKELLDYAHIRLAHCRYGNSKSSCGKCQTPCYKKDMKVKIKEVMGYSGPRLLLYRPHEVIRHIFK